MARYLDSGFVPVQYRRPTDRVVCQRQQPVRQDLPTLRYGRLGLRRHILSIPRLDVPKHVVAAVVAMH